MQFLYKFFIFLFFFQFYFSFAQDQELDSIKKLVETHTKRDTTRVKNLIQYTRYTVIHNDKETKGVILEAIAISEEINFTDGLGSSYSSFALYYTRSGEFKKALEYAEKAKKIQDSIGDVIGLAITNTSIANVYNELKQPKKAITILKENLKLLKGNKSQQAPIHFYLANAYQEVEDFDNAEFHFNTAKKIAESVDFFTGVNIANSSIGVLNIKKGNYKKGILYLEKTLVFYKKNKQEVNIAHSNIEIANAYFKLNKVDKAIYYNEEAIKIYKKQGRLKTLKKAYLQQSYYLNLKNNYKQANFYLKEHYKIKDSLFSKDNIKNIAEMQTKYETEKVTLEKEIAVEKNKKNKTLLYTTLAISGLLLLSALFYFGRYKAKKKTETILNELRETQKRLALEKQYRSSELKALKAQMDPHFIFNALNSIQDYIVLNQKDLASDYLGKFADLMRKYLNFSNKGSVSLQDEIETLNIYLDLEKVRFEKSLTYTITIDDSISNRLVEVPTMLIQPYVENALKHGLLHKKDNKKLTVFFSKQDDKIKCIIQDNGVGREKSKEIQSRKSKSHKSFATKATQERLALLNFGKDKKIGVEIIDLYNDENKSMGTKVILIIPTLTIT